MSSQFTVSQEPQPVTEECAYLNDAIDILHGEYVDCKSIWGMIDTLL